MREEEKAFVFSRFTVGLSADDFVREVGNFLWSRTRELQDGDYARQLARVLWDAAAAKPVTVTVPPIDSYGCLKNRKVGEPFFVLMGHDVIAPATIAFWAREAIRLHVPLEKVKGALGKALDCERWQREHGSKVPD